MKFTLSWLKDHLDTTATISKVEFAMTMAGLEVEHIEDPSSKLAQFSVARIVSAAKHPNADKLQVCQVETKDGVKEIVCGAPNARAGLVTAYAPIGAYIPGSGITLVEKPVRGVVSNGMLCSGAELELDSDADGILELDAELKVGLPLAHALHLNDPVIDFEVTPNRPDWLGVAGIARDLAATGIGRFKSPAVKPVAGKFASPIKIEIDDTDACPMFAGRLVRGLKNGPSPEWLQRRLRAIGIKPRSALVDITNYLTYDRARPLHVYDASKITGTLRARLGREGESFKALDGDDYAITPAMCVIADDARVLGLGGIMGGEYSGCSDATTDVLIECALFDATRTFQTGRATGITSDAQYRFARGVDTEFVVPGIELATAMVLEFCGGEPSEIVVAGKAPPLPQALSFDPDRVRTLAGMDVAPARVKSILDTLGFDVRPLTEYTDESEEADAILDVVIARTYDQLPERMFRVQPPSWRRDVEGGADLVEEIARIEGFDKLPQVAPPRAAGFRPPPASVGESRTRVGRRAAAALGYLEAVTWSFCAKKAAEAFGGGDAKLVLANPIAADLDCMRPSPLPNLLLAAQKNADRGYDDARLFEAGAAWKDDSDSGQSRVIAAVWRARPQRHWKQTPAPDLYDIKRDCLAVLEAVGAPVGSAQTGASAPSWWRPGRSGAIALGNKPMAYFGELHPRVLSALGVEGPVLAFEIMLDAIPAPRAKGSRAKPPLEKLDLMPLTRDFAFVVEEKIAAADLVRAAFGADKQLITDVALFDVYRGKGVDDGKKSLAIEVTLQPREKTLTDSDIEAASNKIVSAVVKATSGTLRS